MEKSLIIILITSIILLISILIIINLIILYNNINIRKIVINYDYENNDINYPSLLVLNNNGKYSTTINNKNDKILLLFGDRRYIKYSFIDIDTCQIINKDEKSKTLIIKSGLKDLKIFSFNYRLYISAKYKDKLRILSLQIKRTYKSNLNSGYFFNEGDTYMALTDEYEIIEINDNNFNKKRKIIKIEGITKEIEICTNPIKINNELVFIGIDKENKNIKLIRIEKENYKIKSIIKLEIDEYDKKPNGLIYNKLSSEIYVSLMNKKNKMIIYRIKIN
jgi:hypothetical protein